ncbi:hypothetical protein K466DRAFT_589778 [Polyporus arcularius HHB13444]|uniref:Uncharacterized protein n=1 Tax=Polyporus arcularius HHB13444 TaxID=1314778 RepID=A0A5C3P302_9APHY|nr:hypothetical protein K466DRAFT_589778 [Polyporus arcularius HHB13444]
MCACLRRAHKYEMNELLHESLCALRKVCPDTYALFQDRGRSAERPNPPRAISVVNQ